MLVEGQFFCSAFFNDWAEKKDEKFIFKKPNISTILSKFTKLKYLKYTLTLIINY
jgi:hypothetical protein